MPEPKKAREFTLIAMTHVPRNVPTLLRVCEQSFRKGDRIAIEVSQPEIDLLRILLPVFSADKFLEPDPKAMAGLPKKTRRAAQAILDLYKLGSRLEHLDKRQRRKAEKSWPS